MWTCCVVGCNNNNKNNKDLKFYRFPGKDYEEEKKNKWIKAVNRINPDGSTWIPSKFARVCSAHFISGRSSNIESHPDYAPSVFPSSYRKRCPTGGIQRFERRKKWNMEGNQSPSGSGTVIPTELVEFLPMRVSTGVQVSFEYDKNKFMFDMSVESSTEKSTQCNIGSSALSNVQSFDKSCGPDDGFKCQGFHGYRSLKDDNDLNDLTGTNRIIFNTFLSFLPQRASISLVNEDVLLLFLMKMKLGLTFLSLAVLFGVSKSTASRLFTKALLFISKKTANLIQWPSRLSVQATMPKAFKRLFPNVRAIIDCTELKTEIPSKISDRINMYSSYKSCHTFKIVIAVTPNGYICFKSPCAGGRMSDTQITIQSGFLELLSEGDVILADKGFPNICTRGNKIIVIPPFVHNGELTPDELRETTSIASVRIHVERCIQRVKIFKILQFVTHDLFKNIDDIVHVACVLTNLRSRLLNDD